jgi:hypothetical protein
VEVLEAEEDSEAEAVAAFLSLRSVAAAELEVCIADCTSGRMWSSTLLKKGLIGARSRRSLLAGEVVCQR